MATYSHGVYIDESGSGEPDPTSVTSLWVSAAIAVPFEHTQVLGTGVEHILAKYFRPGVKEIKGTGTPGTLQKTATLDAVSAEIRDILKATEGRAWVTGTRTGVNPLPDKARNVLLNRPKDIARQLLFERMNAFLKQDTKMGSNWLLVWDLSEQQELNDFSQFVRNFQDGFSKRPRHPRMAPALLGGCSHDWAGLQIADWYAHMGMHYQGQQNTVNFPDGRLVIPAKLNARADKAETFRQILWDALDKGSRGDALGYKAW